jgi:hypothetical protein
MLVASRSWDILGGKRSVHKGHIGTAPRRPTGAYCFKATNQQVSAQETHVLYFYGAAAFTAAMVGGPKNLRGQRNQVNVS